MTSILSKLNQLQSIIPIVPRVLIGVVFLAHGIDKFNSGISNVEGAFTGMGVPVPAASAPVTAVIEVVAGIALIAGLGTRIAAALLSLVMLGALVWVKAEVGIVQGANVDLALLAGTLTLLVTGPGRLSVDQVIGLDRSPVAVVPQPATVGR